MTPVTYEILIPTIPHRHAKLCGLLEALAPQVRPGFTVRVMRDNLQRIAIDSYAKWQDLQELSTAEYTSFAGDDDTFAPDFIPRVMEALQSRPDYVGFRVRFPPWDCQHSLRYNSWGTDRNLMYRDLVHQNPIRRDLALLSRWETVSLDQDEKWAERLRATGKVRTEVWIEEPMYYYQPVIGDGMMAPRQPFPLDQIPPLPEYPWLIVHDMVA